MGRVLLRSRKIEVFLCMSALILCVVLALGLGATISHASPAAEKRIDAPFTMEVKTPHVSWGKPSAVEPVHALVVPSVSEGRTLVELAERFPLTYDTVTIDSAWDVNTWTIGTGKNYEARNYKLNYKYLTEDLTSAAHYDVIVLPSLFGWNRLPQEARDAILRRVRDGAGLVLIHPTTGIPAPDDPKSTRPLNNFAPDYEAPAGGKLWDVSPLVDVLSDRLDNRGFLQVRPDAVTTGSWKAVHPGFVTDNVPLESFPTGDLKHYKYQLGKDSTLLVAGPNGEPVVATKMYGKGRVVALGYENHGLSPLIDWSFLGKQDDHWWEYFYSLLGRSILWAANREPRMTLLPMSVENPGKVSVNIQNSTPVNSASLAATVVNEWGDKEGAVNMPVKLRRGRNSVTLSLPSKLSAGRQYVDVILSAGGKHYDWGTASFVIPKSVQIVSLSTDKQFYTLGDQLQLTVHTSASQQGTLRTQLFDNRRRLIGEQKISISPTPDNVFKVKLNVGNYSTNIGWVRATLLEPHNGMERKADQQQTRVNFVSLDRKFGAYELILPWYGPPSYEPWTSTLADQFRKIGVTVVENPRDNFRIISEVRAPGFGVYWHYRASYLEQKDNYLKTHDTKYLIRKPDLSSSHWLDELRGKIIESMKKDEPYHPLAYYLADESSLTAYGDPLDFSWSEPTLTALRQWLKGQYASLDALNKEWETNFKAWDAVTPLTTSQAQAKGNYAGWMDHRTFMEQVFAHALQVAADTVKAEDPGGLPSISGTQAPGPSNAVNWYLLDHVVGYLQPYSGDDQDDLHRSIHANQILTGFTGYQDAGVELHHQLWHRLLSGQIGASLFWQYTALNADLSMTQQGKDLASLTNEFRNEGLALLLRGARRENCGIAVHYSLLSVRSHWITDGHIAPHEVTHGDATSANLKRFHQNRTDWLQALRDGGYQYDFLTTEQMDKGNLSNYKVLILPDSISLSEGELTAIRNFVEKGGLLIADGETGLMDGHARWQSEGQLDNVLGIQQKGAHAEANDANPVRLHATLDGKTVDFDAIPADPDLEVTSGRPVVTIGNTPFLVDSSLGAGHAVTLNFWMTNYMALRNEQTNGPVLSLLEHYLSQAGIKPVADVRRADGEPVRCSEIVGYRKGDVRFLAVLPGLKCGDTGPVTVRFPHAQYTYDLRAHRLIGQVAEFSGQLVEGEPLLLALSPSPIGKLSLTAAGVSKGEARVKRGGTVSFNIHVTNQSGGNFPEAVRVNVHDPSGKSIDFYGKNLSLVKGTAQFSISLALSDVPGTWTVIAGEPYTHQTSSVKFEIVR